MKNLAILSVVMLLVPMVFAQTSTAPGIDVEIVDPTDGDNGFCVSPNETFTAEIWVRPGTGTGSCSQSCGTVTGGSANLATGVIDVAFDDTKLTYQSSAVGTHYPDVLLQDNTGEGRIGGAMAGDWSPDADTSGTLANPCAMAKLTSQGMLFEVEFQAASDFSGSTQLTLRQEADGFAFSFADGCANVYKVGSGIDEVIHGTVGELVNLSTAGSSMAASPSGPLNPINISTGTSDITITLSDGSPVPGQVVNVDLIGPNYSQATLSAVTDNGDGTYSATLSAGPQPGRAKVRYTAETCEGTFQDDLSEDKVVIINNPAFAGCNAGDANGSGSMTTADATMIILEWADGDTNDDELTWPGAGTVTSSTSCADANGNGSLSTADATAAILMWAEGM